MRKMTAWLLALCLTLGLVTPSFAAQPKAAAGTGSQNLTSVSDPVKAKGFLGKEFQDNNSYRYDEDEQVRAIIIMESAPLTETQDDVASVKAKAYASQLEAEKATVYSAMSANHVDYKLAYTFDTLVNGFSCDVAYGDLTTIAELPGVASVHIANVYSIPNPQPNTVGSGEMTGNDTTRTNGYRGQGIVVAVLDSGVNLKHEAFKEYPGYLTNPVLTKADLSKVDTAGVYYSAKIPFGYDYADRDNNPQDDGADTGGHGTHVSGIAVGYAQTEDGAVTFQGAAPQAQLLAMKIFGTAASTTSSDTYFKALEDAMKLGADVINMSIGSDSGFTHDDELEGMMGNIYKKLEDAGVVVCISAGNSDSMAADSLPGVIGPDYTDYGVVGSPSTYANNISVASMENKSYPQQFIKIGGSDGAAVSFVDSSDEGLWTKTFGGKDVEYALLTDADGNLLIGSDADFAAFGAGVAGKIAVVSRGETSFQEKTNAAAQYGAIGCVVVNNQPGTISMAIDSYPVPAVSLQQSALSLLEDAEVKTLYTDAQPVLSPSSTAGQMSDFSSWGTTPDLTMKPTITSVGGNIWSADEEGTNGYTLMSGTSMACPNMVGTFADLLSYLRTKNPDMSKLEAAQTARAIMESAAELVSDPSDDLLYSVRKQGVGLGHSDYAIQAWESGYVTDPIKELGDSDNGTYSFSVTLKNNSDVELTYNVGAVVMTDSSETDRYGDQYVTFRPTYLFDSLTDLADDGLATVNMPETVTLQPGEQTTVNVSIALTEAGKQYFVDNGFVNGSFVEGFVQFTPEAVEDVEAATVHATFLGYYGDWGKAPAMEHQDFQDFLEYEYLANTTVVDEDGNTYADYGYTGADFLDIIAGYNDVYIVDNNLWYGQTMGSNMLDGYGGAQCDPKYVSYDSSHNVLSTNVEDAAYNYLYVNPYLLRNAKFLEMVITDADTGKEYYRTATNDPSASYIPKARYNSTSGAWVSYAQMLWNGYDKQGQPLPDGTQVHVTFNATLPSGTVQKDCWLSPIYDDEGEVTSYRTGFDLTIDSTAPEVNSAVYDEETGMLTLTATDKNLAGAYLVTKDGIADYAFFEGDGDTQQIQLKVPEGSEVGDQVYVTVLDYGSNQTDKWAFLLPDMGDATVTLVTPSGTQEISAKVGELFTLPNCTDRTTVGDSAEFAFWYPEQLEDASAEDVDVDEVWFAGDLMLVSKDITFYAAYEKGTRNALDTPQYFCPEYMPDDYSGDWAIVGVPYANGYNQFTNPYALVSGLESSNMAAQADDKVAVFTSAEKGLRYTFTRMSDGSYTIRNAKSNQYLAVKDGELAMVSSTSNSAASWIVDAGVYNWSVSIKNREDPTLELAFDCAESHAFELGEVSAVSHPTLGVIDLTAYNYPVTLYRCGDYELTDTVYTTELKKASNGSAAGGARIQPDRTTTATNEDGSTTVTVTNPQTGEYTATTTMSDDSVEVVETKRDGAATTTVTRPDSSKAVRAKDSDGDVAITVTNADGVTLVDMVLPAVFPTKDNGFVDVPEGHFAEDAINQAVAMGLIQGMGNGAFGTNNPITRAQVATILFRLAGMEGKSYSSSFTDVGAGDYFKDATGWANLSGVITGYPDGSFAPNKEISRQDLALMLYRFAKLIGLRVSADTDVLDDFSDGGQVSGYAEEALAWCVSAGIIRGRTTTTIVPGGTATRAEAVVMLQRFLNLMK